MQLHVLGPVEVSADGRSLPLGGPKARAVLAMLGLDANRTVTADHLIEGLWGEHPPASAAKMVQHYVWRLRTTLPDDSGVEILTRGRGYELCIDPDAVDVSRFERLLAAATRADAADRPSSSAREALALWRGSPLSDVADEPFAASEIRRLEELRVEAAELAIAADLAACRHQAVAAEIVALVEAHPLRERLHAQRMLALYRCGRQADALEAYRAARRTLVEQIGVEPGPELQRLHLAILGQDPALDVEPPTRKLPHELDASGSPPLVGRDAELEWLRGRWQHAQAGAGGLVTLAGGHGMGKTRLAAEVAGEAHHDDAAVLYVGGARTPEAALAAIAAAREPARPTLLVLEDADRAGPEACAAIASLADELQSVTALVLATGRDATVLSRLQPSGSLVLEPLDAAAVRQIAGLHAPAGTDAAVPVDSLLDATGGVPRRVHEAASEWARREAARRVEAVAGRAAAGRMHARALEHELAGTVVDLQSVHERAGLVAGRGRERARPLVCPYKGLAPFEADDADYFFGREQLVADLVARLVGAPLLAVVGPSGSGKSSVVRAGLLPALARGILPGSEHWGSELIRPGEHPMRLALDRLGGGRRSVLVVDQFEELFTACTDEHERGAFVATLVSSARDREDAGSVVVAVRADFYGRCAEYPQLSALMGANHVLVGPMTRDELRRAIELPAHRAGLHLEPGLADRVLADCEGEPGALPLLSTALLELWQQRTGSELHLAGYERIGGVRGAVARLAEAAYERLDREQRAVARSILLRLADDDVDGAPVRRRIPLAALDGDASDVLQVLAGSRMVTVGDGAVEVAHEALLREWPRLRRWLAEDRDGRRLHRHLGQAALEWDKGGRDPAELYRGARLASALEWRGEHQPELNATEQQFLSASRAAGERARRRLRLVLAGILALLVLTTGAAVLALDQRSRARDEARAAAAQALAAQALSEEQLDRSLLLARQAVAVEETPATRDSLLSSLRRSPAAVAVMPGDGDALGAIALHPDGRTLAVGDLVGRVVFLDAVSRRRLGPPHRIAGASRISALAFSPDGTRLASAGWDTPGAVIDLFDARDHRHIVHVAHFPTAGEASVHFSPDSRILAAQDEEADERASDVPIWSARTGVGRRLPQSPGATLGRSTNLLGFLGSDARVVTSSAPDRSMTIRDAATLRPLRRFATYAPISALSTAGGMVALGRQDGSVGFLDVRTGELRIARGHHEAPVVAIRFDTSGRWLATASSDGRLIVWDARRAAILRSVEAGGAGAVQDLAVAPDGNTVYSAGRDGTVIAWDLVGERLWERPFGTGVTRRRSRALMAAEEGASFAVIDDRGFVELFDSGTLRPLGRVEPRAGDVSGAAVAPDGRTVAVTTFDGLDGTVELWDAPTRQRLGPSHPGHARPARAVSFSADGRWLVTGDDASFVRLWDVRRRVPRRSALVGVADVSLSPDGSTLAATLENRNFGGGLQIRSVPGLDLIRTVELPSGTVGRFSPDGRSLVYGDREGRVWVLDTRNWKPRRRPFQSRGVILSADFSPDGRLLATTSSDGTGRLWDTATGRAVGAELSAAPGNPIGAAFIRGGSHLAVLHRRGGVAWDVRPGAWVGHACRVAGRALTRAEWQAALPQHDYAPACAPG